MEQSIKHSVISFLKTLPEDVSIEDIMYHIYAQQKILKGLKEADEGKTVSHEKAKEIMKKWLT